MSAAASNAGRALNIARDIRQEVKKQRLHIQLRGLPFSATPADIRRMITLHKVGNVSDVALDYYRLRPTGRAYLTITHSDFLEPNLKALHNATLSSLPISSYSAPPPSGAPPSRTRGVKGRKAAVDRGVYTGTGPDGGIVGTERSVVIWGLPRSYTTDEMTAFLNGYELWKSVIKLESLDPSYSGFSRHLVQLTSVSDAHRLVRQLHMTYFQPDQWGERYQIRARVIY